jgi:hypothetical protein
MLGQVRVSKTATTIERAEQVLRELFEPSPEEAVSRHNALLRLGGGVGTATLPERRRWAEAWQLLERGGLICREPNSRRDDWFLTGAGKQALAGGDVAGALLVAGVRS